MKKNMLSILIAAAGTMLSAAELNVSGNFARLQTSGFPHDWYLNGYAGYKPEPKFDSVAENGLRILHFSDIKGKSGFGVSSRKPFACSAGNKVVVTAKLKGAGAAWFGLHIAGADEEGYRVCASGCHGMGNGIADIAEFIGRFPDFPGNFLADTVFFSATVENQRNCRMADVQLFCNVLDCNHISGSRENRVRNC